MELLVKSIILSIKKTWQSSSLAQTIALVALILGTLHFSLRRVTSVNKILYFPNV